MSALDEDLHSRQIWTYGRQAMERLASTSVAVIGLNGVGAEVAKNLILANMKRVTLVDDRAVSFTDLSSHFYLTESDIGRNRAQACLHRLQELNPAVRVEAHGCSAVEALLTHHTAVVVCDWPLVQAEKLNTFCRERSPPVRFVLAQSCGLCFRVFSDFGAAFEFVSSDSPYTLPICNIDCSSASVATVHVMLDTPTVAAPDDGDTVVFSDILGAVQLNNLSLVTKNKRRYESPAKSGKWFMRFDVDTAGLHIHAYTGNGRLTQVITPQSVSFNSLTHCLADPGMLFLRQWKPTQPPAQLHVAFAACNLLSQSPAAPSTSPAPIDTDHFLAAARSVYDALPSELKESFGDLDESLMRAFARCCGGQLNPIAAIAGGIAAQEAIKACAQKFLPMIDPQWLCVSTPNFNTPFPFYVPSDHVLLQLLRRPRSPSRTRFGRVVTRTQLPLRQPARCVRALDAGGTGGSQSVFDRGWSSRLRAAEELCDDGDWMRPRGQSCSH